MRISLATRAAARACAVATVVFSLGVTPLFARMGGSGGAPLARSALGFGHFHHFAPRGFNQRFGFNQFGFKRFDRFGVNRFGRFGFNRFGSDRFGNQLFIGGWDGWGDVPVPTGASDPIIVGGGAPVIINIGADPTPVDAGPGTGGGCVTHKLIYDSNGKYVGERQTSQC
jgi:hypothetical protein